MTLAEFAANLKKPRIVGICGSNRVGSFNKMLLDHVMAKFSTIGAEVEIIDIAAMGLPMYDSQLEKTDFPAAAVTLKEKLTAADALLFTCPEFNGGVTPMLLNAITWATRGAGEMYAGFKGKIASVMATSPGRMGGMRMCAQLDDQLAGMGCIIIHSHVAIGGAFKAFDKDGKLTDDRAKQKINVACGQVFHFAKFEANRASDDLINTEMQKLKLYGEA